jgi:hypothetical protein
MKMFFRRLLAACTLFVMPALSLAPVGAMCMHDASAAHAAVAQHDAADEHKHHHSSAPATPASQDAPECPMEQGQTGCTAQTALPSWDGLPLHTADAVAFTGMTAFDDPHATDPSPIFHPPRA